MFFACFLQLAAAESPPERTEIHETLVTSQGWWAEGEAYVFGLEVHEYEGPYDGAPISSFADKGTRRLLTVQLRRGGTELDLLPEAPPGLVALTELANAAFTWTDETFVVELAGQRVQLPGPMNIDHKPRWAWIGPGEDLIVVTDFHIGSGSWGFTSTRVQAPMIFPGFASAERHNSAGFDAYRAGDMGGAERGFRAALAFDPTHKHANFNLACVWARSGRPFSEVHPVLDVILGQDALRATYLGKIARDPDLEHFREAPGYAGWAERWRHRTD